MLVLLVSASPAMARGALPLNDADGDGWSDNFENATGSSPASPLKTPESIATSALSDQQPYQSPEKQSCLDGKDNDGDGLVDSNFGAADPGCAIPPVETTSFAGANDFAAPVHTEISTIDVPLPFPGNPHCIFKFAGDGGAVVNVDPPVAGTAAAEVIAVQIDGVAEVTGPVTCPLGIGYKNAIQIIEDPNAASPGTFTDNNPAPGIDFPATASVDLHAVLISPLGNGGFSGIPLTNNNVTQIPPYCTNCDLNNPANDCFSAGLLKMCMLPPATAGDVDLDNFKQYQIKAPKFPAQNVTLQDAYGGSQAAVVKKPTHLATPAKTTPSGDPIIDPDAHLTCYQIKAPNLPKPYPTVLTADPYGHRTVTLTKRTSLCTPTQVAPNPAPVGLNNFECYKAKPVGKPVLPALSFEDEFGTQSSVAVSTLTSFCAPVSLNGGSVPDPDAYLTSYKVSQKTNLLSVNPVDLTDAFGSKSGVKPKGKAQYVALPTSLL